MSSNYPSEVQIKPYECLANSEILIFEIISVKLMVSRLFRRTYTKYLKFYETK